MIQVPQFPHMYVSAAGLDQETRCSVLLGNPRIMVDRATREDCGKPASRRTDDGQRQGHAGHGDHNH